MMRWKLAVAAVAVLFAAAIAQAQDTIKIGVAGPMTGPNAQFGIQLQKGAEAARDAINAAGGIGGKKVELVVGDDACDPKQAPTVANRLVEAGVVGVVGHFCSGSSIPASEVYAENNIIEITPASTNPKFTERGLTTVFRTCGRDDQQGYVAAKIILEKLHPKAIAIIHDKSTYGQGLADAMKAALNGKFGTKEVLYEGINQGDKDFNSLITKLKGLNVDVIYFGGYHTEAGLLVRQAREQGLKAKLVAGDALVTEEFAQVVGSKEATLGVWMTFGADPMKYPEAKGVVAKFMKEGYTPEGYTLYTYAAMQVLADALKANGGSKDGKKLAAYLRSKSFPTVMGPKEFDAKGDLKVSDYVMYGWIEKDGKVTYAELP